MRRIYIYFTLIFVLESKMCTIFVVTIIRLNIFHNLTGDFFYMICKRFLGLSIFCFLYLFSLNSLAYIPDLYKNEEGLPTLAPMLKKSILQL